MADALHAPLGAKEPVNHYRDVEAQLAQARGAIVAAQESLRGALELALKEYRDLAAIAGLPELALEAFKDALRAAARPPFSTHPPLVKAGQAFKAAEARLAAALAAFDQGAVDAAVKEVGGSVPLLLPSCVQPQCWRLRG